MRRAFAVLCATVALAGCGSSDTSNPMAACNSLVTAVCNRESACNNLNGTPVAACITAAETNLNCSSASCPAGTTFSSSAANQCVSDVNNESCTDIQNEDTPASCSTTCH